MNPTNNTIPTMNPTTLQALHLSIDKWQAIVDGTNKERPGADNCPLCELFFTNKCLGCPVRDATGFGGCSRTPYNYVMQQANSYGIDSFEYRSEARSELNFLKSLLPR